MSSKSLIKHRPMKYWLNFFVLSLAIGLQLAHGQKMGKNMHMPAASGPVLSLDSVLQRVERRNPAVQQYAYQAQAKEAAVAGYNSWEAPKVSAGLWMTPYNQRKARELSGMDGGAGTNQLQGQAIVSVEQMIPNPAKQRARREYLSSQSAAVLADRQYRVVQLRAQAIITPACGLAGHGISQAARSLGLASELANRVSDQAVAARLSMGA